MREHITYFIYNIASLVHVGIMYQTFWQILLHGLAIPNSTEFIQALFFHLSFVFSPSQVFSN